MPMHYAITVVVQSCTGIDLLKLQQTLATVLAKLARTNSSLETQAFLTSAGGDAVVYLQADAGTAEENRESVEAALRQLYAMLPNCSLQVLVNSEGTGQLANQEAATLQL